MDPQAPTDVLFQSYDRNLYKITGNEEEDDIIQALSSDPTADNSANVQTSASDVGSGVSTSTTQQANGSTQQGKSTYDNTVTGYILGMDPASGFAKFYIGNQTKYLNWTGTSLVISGAFQVGNSITISTSDDIQTAINTLTPTGGTVFLEAGTWTLSSDITIATGVNLVGAGTGLTIINFNNTAHAIKATSVTNFLIQDLTVESAHNTSGGAAINLNTCTNFVVRNVEVSGNPSNYGLLADNCATFTFDTVYAHINGGVSGTEAAIGVINDTVAPTEIILINCRVTANSGSGILMTYDPGTANTQSGPVTVINCHADGNSLSGFFVTQLGGADGSTSFPAYIGCTANGNTLSGFFSTLNYSTFISCTADNNTLTGFFCEGAYNTFTSCNGDNNGFYGWDIESGADYVSITSCRANGNAKYGFINNVSSGAYIGNDAHSNTLGNYTMPSSESTVIFQGNMVNGAPYDYPFTTSRFWLRRTDTTVALVDGATPALDASLGNIFTLAAGGDRTIAVPSNPQNGQQIIIEHTAVTANRTLALNAGTGGFSFGTTITGLTVTTSGKTDYITARYNGTAALWHVIGYQKGY